MNTGKLVACVGGIALLWAGRSGWGNVPLDPMHFGAPPPIATPDIGIGDYDADVRNALANGDFYLALEWVQQAIEHDPEDYRARFMRAVLNSHHWPVKNTRADLERVAAVKPPNGLVMTARLQLALINRVHDQEAIRLLGNVSQWPRGGYWVARFLGEVLVEREQFKEAAERLAPLVAAASTPDPWLLGRYATALSHIGETERAVTLARQAVAMLPDRALYNVLAAVLYRSGDIPAADEAMKQHMERYPRRGLPLTLFLDSVKAEPNVETGIRRYEDVMAAALVYPNQRLQQAMTYAYIGKPEASIPILEELAKTAPLRYRAEALRRLGEHYISGWAGVQAQPENAQALLLEAAELGDAIAAANLAFDFYDYPQRGDREPAEAYRFYQMAVQRGHLQSLRNLGIMYRSGRGIPKDPEKALILYLKVMQTGCAIAHNNAAWLLLSERRMWDEEAAVRWAEIGAGQHPCNPHFNTLIRVYLRIGDIAAADQAWHRWHRWWTPAHGSESALPRNYQQLRDTIDRKRGSMPGGENS